jgi:hypothetical protein
MPPLEESSRSQTVAEAGLLAGWVHRCGGVASKGGESEEGDGGLRSLETPAMPSWAGPCVSYKMGVSTYRPIYRNGGFGPPSLLYHYQ